MPRSGIVMAALLALATAGATAQQPAPLAQKPVPKSPYLSVVYRYADTMIERGRDTHGPQKTGLLLSALDRAALAPVEGRVISDPQLDQNLLRLLYTLSELSNKPVYRDAADAELRWFLRNAVSRAARLAPWDEGLAWDASADIPVPTTANRSRPWMLWDRCFDLEPEGSGRLVDGLRERTAPGAASPRHTAYALRAFSVAYQRTGDGTLLKAIESSLARLEAEPDAASASRLSAAIDCGGAAGRVPEPLASRLRTFAASQDRLFCELPHDPKGTGGFALRSEEREAKSSAGLTPLWHSPSGGLTTAAVAMMCVSRYENTGNVNYRELVHAAADAYRHAVPADDALPLTFGHAISLQLAAWRSTARPEYLDRATQLADLAVQRFWDDNPLPRAGATLPHYDTVTGADTLALALVELHPNILHITAVRCPPNTIDR